MNQEIAIVGDIHGNLVALEDIVEAANSRTDQFVFVGDYINKGPTSAAVIDYLIEMSDSPIQATFLRGNHEVAFQEYLEGGPVADFLRIGGAATLRSYQSVTGPFHEHEFRHSIPTLHRHFLRSLKDSFETDGLFVTHSLRDPIPPRLAHDADPVFRVAGHTPQRARRPHITEHLALIDTGCGTWDDGVVTCLFWPSIDWIQAP